MVLLTLNGCFTTDVFEVLQVICGLLILAAVKKKSGKSYTGTLLGSSKVPFLNFMALDQCKHLHTRLFQRLRWYQRAIQTLLSISEHPYL